MQLVEATHVLAAVMLFGTVLIVDLRLLGLPTRRARSRASAARRCPDLGRLWDRRHHRLADVHHQRGDLLRQSRVPAEGARAVGAGLNMALFQLFTARGVAAWDFDKPPRAARIAGLVSVLLWARRGSAGPLDRIHERLRLHHSARRRAHVSRLRRSRDFILLDCARCETRCATCRGLGSGRCALAADSACSTRARTDKSRL